MTLKSIIRHFIILNIFCAFQITYTQIKVSQTPQWVIEQSYDKSPDIETKDISYGLLTLLSDEQIHIPKKERYIRFARKITDNVGIQDGSSISINYDPTYQQLTLHSIVVYRNGKRINKLNVNDFQVIRKESNSESYIYDGSLNAVANLADIRNGDILDVAYSIKGFNPIHGDHFSGATALNDFQPVGKINYYLISKRKLNYKLTNTQVEPKVSTYNGYITYNWQTTLAKAPEFEDNTPSWYMAYDNLFVSDYNSWAEVVLWGLNVYEKDGPISQALRTKIEEIKSNFDYEGDRIRVTLKFVQEEIRYLGLESGIGAYKPFSPNKVFEQRFGDCKDKTWLMVSMLRAMNIEAYPALVNTYYGETLHEFLPSPKVFDHVVVKVINKDGEALFYDPTLNNQFGHHDAIAFPEYGNVLVIKDGVTAPESVTNNVENLVEVYDTFDLPTVGGPATLRVHTLYKGAEADMMRRRYKYTSLSNLSKEFKSYYEDLYDGVEVIEEPSIDDDSLSNRLIVEEHYKINSIWKPMVGNEKNISADFSPYSILDVFISPNTKERQTPFALYYPSHKKHHITVMLPRKWSLNTDDVTINSKSFIYSMQGKLNNHGNILYLDYEYENKKGYVSLEDFNEFYTKIKEAEEILSYYVYIPKSYATSEKLFNSFEGKKIVSSFMTFFYWALGIAVAIIVGLIFFVRHQNRNREF